jgi:hypothetical protein
MDLANMAEAIVAQKLCAQLDCNVLVSDDSPNPFSWLLVTPEGEKRAVYLKTEAMEQEIYILGQ